MSWLRRTTLIPSVGADFRCPARGGRFRPAEFGRLLLSVLFLAVMPTLAPVVSAVRNLEIESPVEQAESNEEIALSSSAAVQRPRRSSAPALLLVPAVETPKVRPTATVPVAPAGHRFANGLVAPLRC